VNHRAASTGASQSGRNGCMYTYNNDNNPFVELSECLFGKAGGFEIEYLN
jgi:hypothetical protein